MGEEVLSNEPLADFDFYKPPFDFHMPPARSVNIPNSAAVADALVNLAKALNVLVATFEIHEPSEKE